MCGREDGRRGKLEKEGESGSRGAPAGHGLVRHVDLDLLLLLIPHFNSNDVCLSVFAQLYFPKAHVYLSSGIQFQWVCLVSG